MPCKKDSYIHGPKVLLGSIPGSNFGQFLLEKMRENDQKIYQINPETGEQWSYGKTADYTVRVALEMQSRGIKPGQNIAIVAMNHLKTILPAYASFLLGATVTPIHPKLDDYEFKTIFGFTKPDLVFCDLDCKNKIENAFQKLQIKAPIVTFEEDFFDFLDEKHKLKIQHFHGVSVDVNESIAMVLCTSGTTGDTKGVPVTHYGIFAAIKSAMATTYQLEETDILLSYSPLSWVSAMKFYAVTIMRAGIKLVANYHPEKHFNWVNKYRVNFIIANPNLVTEIIKHPKFESSSMKFSTKLILFGGSAASLRQIDEFYENFPNAKLINCLGSTENFALHVTVYPMINDEILKSNRYALGFLTPNAIGKLVDEVTEEIITEPNRPGELCIKSPSLFKGYLNKPDLNQKIFDGEGFYRTGDICIRDEDGIFSFIGRINDTFKYQHHKIDPLEIENAIGKHSAVRLVCVMGKPDPFNVELPIAFVVKNSGFETTTEEEIIQFVDNQVKEYQRLRGGIIFLDHFPLTSSGKIRKLKLRELIL